MKVGKAIYNILSRAIPVQQNIGFSTDTFAPSGEELVTNGDFSGVTEFITCGDFSCASPGNSWTATNAILSFANSRMTVDDSNDEGDDSRGTQIITTVIGKKYTLTYNRISTTSSFYLAIGSNNTGFGYRNIYYSGNMGTTTGVYTRQFTATSTTTYIGLITAGTGVSVYSNVSVKELGEDWSLSGDVSFNTGGALFNIVNGAFTKCSQSISYTVGKSYKVSFDLTGDGSTNDLKVMDDGGSAGGLNKFLELSTATPTTHTFYFVANANSDAIYFKRNTSSGDYSFTIDNVSVQEMILTKIFPEIAPPDIDPPYIVYSVVSNQPSNTKNENGEIDEASLEVYSFQDTYNKTVDLGVAVRASLDRVNGTFATVKVDSINYTNEQMDVNESRKLWAAIQDYTVRIKNI